MLKDLEIIDLNLFVAIFDCTLLTQFLTRNIKLKVLKKNN